MAEKLTTYDDFDISTIMTPLLTLMMIMAAIVILPAISTTTAQAQQYYLAQSYTGLTDDRVLKATHTMQWLNLISNPPYHPWISAYY